MGVLVCFAKTKTFLNREQKTRKMSSNPPGFVCFKENCEAHEGGGGIKIAPKKGQGGAVSMFSFNPSAGAGVGTQEPEPVAVEKSDGGEDKVNEEKKE